ncbi:endoglucanase [Candidatus Planktophila vernalis]|uniref:cellulase n=1 Tax=Candidatus Planktophila vernalis TaxID=1884907 RepID=A0A249KTN2_9ACTN|nr:glycoside hydrolase family 5 protein [Candidatus Planktophila vernalis]ASY20173.1 endoglucanase [Candidatus Planktophila vernalis]
MKTRMFIALSAILSSTFLYAIPAAQAFSPKFPLSTSGNKIVDSSGAQVILQGVNWYGMENEPGTVIGLNARDYKLMLKQIKQTGFNVIRIPFSMQTLTKGKEVSSVADYIGSNRELKDKSPIEVLDALILEANVQGLMIILDNHSQADQGYRNDLWYGQAGYTEDDWVEMWKSLAIRYKDSPNVVGFDLKNEPHGKATWGDGSATDFRRAAERAGTAIQEVNPNPLIIVEGIENQVAGGQKLSGHWWGGNLEGVRNNPVRLPVANKVVYSPHEYGPEVSPQPWLISKNLEKNLLDRWSKGFGYIHDQKIAPILIGEFGAKDFSTKTISGRWMKAFTDYLGKKGMSWTYWAWNPGSADTGGLLTPDLVTLEKKKMPTILNLIKVQKKLVAQR